MGLPDRSGGGQDLAAIYLNVNDVENRRHAARTKAAFPVRTSYNLSFTAASLRPDLARVVAEVYLSVGDWNTAKVHVLTSNALQARSARSCARFEGEFRRRLQTLTAEQLALLARSTADDRAAMAWLSVLKRNALALDFVAELLRDKLEAHDSALRRSDYEGYIDAKAVAHPELAALTPSSRAKIRQVMLRMCAEAGLLRPATRASGTLGMIQRPILSPAATRAVVADAPGLLAGFLVTDREILRA